MEKGLRKSTFYTGRSRIVGTIRSPLGFFALALLIVEGFLLGAGVFFELSPLMRIIALGVGVSLFLIVFAIVCWLVVRHPTNLVFSEDSHIKCKAMRLYGDSARGDRKQSARNNRDRSSLKAQGALTFIKGQVLTLAKENVDPNRRLSNAGRSGN